MVKYETPGVYYERVDAQSPQITAVRTDIAGFIGLAPKGPVDAALPVESFRQFQAHYGEFTGSAFLAYAVRGFFENGGRRCWIVRVASNEDLGGKAAASRTLRSPAPAADVWRVSASSPGVWGNNLTVLLVETHQAQTLSIPAQSKPQAFAVAATAGFARGTLVRISQPGAATQLKVVSAIDPVNQLLIWLNPNPAARLAYDTPLTGIDPDRPAVIESIEYTLLVRQSGTPIFLRQGLALIPEHPSYGPVALPPIVNPADLEARGVLPPTPNPVVIEEARTDLLSLTTIDTSAGSIRLAGGAEGLSLLTVEDFLGEPVAPEDNDVARAVKNRGLQRLADIDEVSMIAMPDINIRPVAVPPKAPRRPCIPDPCLPSEPPPAPFIDDVSTELPPVFSDNDVYRAQAAMVQMCEDLRDRIAILDAPFPTSRNDRLGGSAIRAWRSRFDSKYAALYYPWLRVSDPLRNVAGLTREIPPSGHVTGQCARTDFEIGVHAAPANSPLGWTQDVTAAVNDETHGQLNTLGINVIKPLAGRGTRIMGSRTVTSDPDWIYLNVRRLIMMIEKSIYLATQWAVFEPNDWSTRAKIRLSLSSFLITLWQQGALMGAVPDEAFFVKCDDDNNPPRETDNGRLIADVGVAPSIPFEFVVLRVGRQENEFEIEELRATGGS
jgi:phage tail sheath protein FI